MGKEREMGNSRQKKQREPRRGDPDCSGRGSPGVLGVSALEKPRDWLGRQAGGQAGDFPPPTGDADAGLLICANSPLPQLIFCVPSITGDLGLA